MNLKVCAGLAALALTGAVLGCGADAATTPVQAVAVGTMNGTANPNSYTFALIGDMPYGQNKADSLPGFIRFMNADPSLEMVLHSGDIKAGSRSPCTDSLFVANKLKFDAITNPFVYTPGDNEWTDCHIGIKNNGLFTPTERLQKIRSLFFPNIYRSLGQTVRYVTPQGGEGGQFNDYIENVRFEESGVTFVTLNITGSNDDLASWGTTLPANAGNYPSQAAERALRWRANLRWMNSAFAYARAHNSRGIVFLYQADMWDPAEPTLAGFDDYVREFGEQGAAFGKPILLLHGDSHAFRVDQPFTANSPFYGMHTRMTVAPNITRLVNSGSGSVTSYVRITIDKTGNGPLFSWKEVQYK